MKSVNAILAAGTLVWLAGCATPSKVTVFEPVGPAPTGQAAVGREGSLQVYSAREEYEPVNINGAVWAENEYSSHLPYERAHTPYSIYTANGKVFEKVRNSRGINDDLPTVVNLPAGSYKIVAETREKGSPVLVEIPVVIEGGQTTTVHLGYGWQPPTQAANENSWVRLPDGRIVGWRASTGMAARNTQ